ncbi:cbb3-type cytochrome oxidase assembly protein CcoS [Mesorhizobium sp.]|uniref:cbb3-type cytochrome oxidase assembly protein CcoS n=1 Tax=Mesorhizobium sp. TaxID=1871066 RepID=UPI000FE8463B|nr:cbb3-type cytochrome oxidase assembly protein CcoS [Mesorhizobium sp.]RWP16342.1 MAG: cbb3-type cytochrome oxidase assembly protein CcoS [Mesorhizobium sp.]RWQ26051.1 MAG: cbb3-type cytochrome oxidase assembly protein CcoS [Mesorhizobium sp.]
MSYLAFLVPIAILLGLSGLAAFMWTLRSGQYDDLDGAAERILMDDECEWINSSIRITYSRPWA